MKNIIEKVLITAVLIVYFALSSIIMQYIKTEYGSLTGAVVFYVSFTIGIVVLIDKLLWPTIYKCLKGEYNV